MDKYPCDFGLEPKPDQDEAALAAFNRGYKGTCTNCGKYGHKSRFCPEKRGKKGQNAGCYICGQHGHFAINCKEEDLKKLRKNKCWICGEMGHIPLNCPLRKENQEKANLACEVKDEYGYKSLEELGF